MNAPELTTCERAIIEYIDAHTPETIKNSLYYRLYPEYIDAKAKAAKIEKMKKDAT